MLSKKLALLILTTGISCSHLAHAQYTGPSAQPPLQSIADIMQKSKDDQAVILYGYLTQQISAEKYIFSDGQQSIQVEIDEDDFRGLQIDEKTHIKIIGKIEKDFLQSPEIEVELIQIAPK